MFDEIALCFLGRSFACRHADHAFAAAPLRAKRADRRALDKAAMGDADDAAFVRDQILHVDLAFVRHELGQARGAVLVARSRSSFLMISKTRDSFARMSSRSLIVSINPLYSLTIFSRSRPVS